MGYKRTVYGKHNGAYNYSEFLCDTAKDVEELPTNSDKKKYTANCAIGSKALVVEDGTRYVLNSEGIWKKVTLSITGGQGSDSSDGADIILF